MIPLPQFTLLLLPLWALGLPLIGESVLWLVSLLPGDRARLGALSRLSLAERAIWDLAIGTAALVIAGLAIAVFGLVLTAAVAFGLVLVPAALAVVRLVRGRGTLLRRLLARVRAERWEILGLAGLFAVTLGVRLWVYNGLYLYAGPDIRFYTFYTQQILATGHLFPSLRSIVFPGWMVASDLHQWFSGAEDVFAVMNLWWSTDTPQLASGATLLFSSAIPLSVYALGRALFRDRGRGLPLMAGFVIGLATSYPSYFLSWGGIDETVIWVVFPIAVAVTLLLLDETRASFGMLLLATLLVAGGVLISPLSLVYVTTLTIGIGLEVIVRRRSVGPALARLFVPIAGGVALASPALVRAAAAWQANQAAQAPGAIGWGTFATAPIIRYGPAVGSLQRFLTNSTPLDVVAVVVVLGYLGLALSVRRVRWVPALLVWMAMLFAFNENGPYGLYWVRFPGWTAVFPDRPADLLFVPLSLGVGLLTARLHSLARGPPAFTRSPEGSSPPSAGHPRSGPPSAAGRPGPLRVAGAIGLVAVVALSGGVSVSVAQTNQVNVDWANGFSPADLEGFAWLQAHEPAGSTVLVTDVDAGNWLPAFTDLREFPDAAIVNNASLLAEYATMVEQITDSNYTAYSELARAYDLRAAYFGSQIAYTQPVVLAPPPLLQPPFIFYFVSSYHLCLPPTAPWIARLACNNDTLSLVGPIAFSETVYDNGAVVGTFNGSVPMGDNLTFVLHEYTAQFPGNWDAAIVSQPLAAVAYQVPGSSAEVLSLNPEFASTTCTIVPFSSCAPVG
ncbi:MAG TPA: hypothetical protein VEL82_00940 [Thermoplasmata archaeon]|nr:hypothetical protein [Thermoplasmata archaeon]